MTTEFLFETIPFAGEQEWLGQELGEYEEEEEFGRGRAGGRRRPRPIRPRPRPYRPGFARPRVVMPDWPAAPEPPADSAQPCGCTPPCDCAACQASGQVSAEPVDQPSDEEFAFETGAMFENGAMFETLEFESGGPSRSAPAQSASCTTSFVDCPPQGAPSAVLDAFAFDRSELNAPRHGPILVDVARRIVASQGTPTPIRSLLVAGHTDPVGDDNYNFGLARRRAENVARELCRTIERMKRGGTRGLSLRLTSCGERQTKGRPQESRRVEIHLPARPVRPGPPGRRPCPPGVRERVRLHLKILVPPTRFSIEQMLAAMRQVYRPSGLLVEVASRERLRLPALEDVDLFCPGNPTQTCCPFPCASANLNAEHNALFRNRRGVGANDLAVYFVRSTIPGLNGCCAHPPGRPGVIVAATASRWSLAHEVGHVLGLAHVNNNDRLMTGNGTDNITNPPPDLIASEVATMIASPVSIPC